MRNINLLKNSDLFERLEDINFIRERRRFIDDFLKKGDFPLPKGAVLLPYDWVTAENPNPSLFPRLSVPFVPGYKYYVAAEHTDYLAYLLAGVKVGNEEKLLLVHKNGICCLSKSEMRFPEKSDKINYIYIY